MLQRASDGWFTVAPTEQKFWPRVCKAIERPDLKEDHRSVDMSARFKNAEWLHEELAKEFVKMPRDHWIKELLVNDVLCGPCYDYAGLREEPQVWEWGVGWQGSINELTHAWRSLARRAFVCGDSDRNHPGDISCWSSALQRLSYGGSE